MKKAGDPTPCLASIAIGEGSPFNVYQKQQRKSVEKLGMAFKEVVLPLDVSTGSLKETLRTLNADRDVHGIILAHPLPRQLDFFSLMEVLSPEKDVDGVGPLSLGRLMAGRRLHAPAVALASLDILRHYGVSPSGKRVIVVGRSETVGLPTALLLLAKGIWGDATVTVAHSRSSKLDDILLSGEIIVSCAGVPGIVNRRNVAEGAVIVDVGLSTVPEKSREGTYSIVGDVDRRDLDGWASGITPVPGGVGPVTVAELLRNLLTGWELTLDRTRGE